MKEYNAHLEYYRNYWYAHFTKMMTASEWGNKEAAELFLSKYWLTEDEYQCNWLPIQNNVFFNYTYWLPDLNYSPEFSLIALRGGCLFLEEDFLQIQRALMAIGEKQFVVIQNTFGGKLEEPPLRMKFPVDITWKEITSGNYISSIQLEIDILEYFVFGADTGWGKYSASDNFDCPVDLIGFKHDYLPIFSQFLIQTEKEKNEIINWLPEKYKNLVVK